jgi:quercetin dioxygenase-like cupin family protein
MRRLEESRDPTGWLDRSDSRRSNGSFPATASPYQNSTVPLTPFKLEATNCDVLLASYPAGTSIPPHRHQTENIGVITEGELILTLKGQENRYGPGQWYHVPALAVHAARFDKETSEIEFWFKTPFEAA